MTRVSGIVKPAARLSVRRARAKDSMSGMRVENGEVGIEVDVHGSGRPVVLLHGFPDSARLWRHQVPALVDAGWQAIVPDLRGYGRSDKPEDTASYAIPHVVTDVVRVLDALDVERAAVVGHDWGAAIAWALGFLVPDRVERLVVMSVGHPLAFRSAGLRQRELSWYMLLFQFRGIAEDWLRQDGWANFRAWGRHPDADAVIAELERDGSLTSALDYYRANVPPETFVAPAFELPPVSVPTMGLWSTEDPHLTEEQMTGSAAYVSGSWRYERVPDVGHWLQLEAPDEVNRLLVDFLSSRA